MIKDNVQAVQTVLEKMRIRIKHPYNEQITNIVGAYFGETKDGLPHGLGIVDYNYKLSSLIGNKGYFRGTGHFENGKFHGKVIFQTSATKSYMMTLDKGKCNGRIFINEEDSLYSYNGSYKKKLENGFGKLTNK